MVTIGICEKSPRDDDDPPSLRDHLLVINGEPVYDSWATSYSDGLVAGVYDPDVVKLLLDCTFTDLGRSLQSLYLTLPQPICDWIQRVEATWLHFRSESCPILSFRFNIDATEWAKPWTINEYAHALEDVVGRRNLPGLGYFQKDEIVTNDLALRCAVSSPSALLRDEIERWSAVVSSVCAEAEHLLARNARPDALTAFFVFPPEIRPACEQYLIYFVQFLEDLGIKATSELRGQARGVLFTVIPESGAEALERVREALDIYLQVPAARDFTVEVSRYTDVAAQQLAANVYHLKSQLALAHAVLQAKEATIESLQLSNLRYRQLMGLPARGETPQPADGEQSSEPLLGGAVNITKYRGKGFEINLPLILQKLRRALKP